MIRISKVNKYRTNDRNFTQYKYIPVINYIQFGGDTNFVFDVTPFDFMCGFLLVSMKYNFTSIYNFQTVRKVKNIMFKLKNIYRPFDVRKFDERTRVISKIRKIKINTELCQYIYNFVITSLSCI